MLFSKTFGGIWVRRFIYIIILLSIILITACSEDTNQEEQKDIEKREKEEIDHQFSYNGQEVEIIYYFDHVINYARYKNRQPDLDHEEGFTGYVLNPFRDKVSLNDDTLEKFPPTSSQVEDLIKHAYDLDEKEERISHLIEEALIHSIEVLPGKDISVYVFPVNPEDQFIIYNIEGIRGASSFRKNNIILMVAPTFTEERLKYTVAHEYHHTVNMENNGRKRSKSSLLDTMITEGKADAFAKMVYPEIKVPLTEALSENEASAVLEKLRKNVDSTDREIYSGFLYGGYRDIPRWSNYKIGYVITNSFIENNPDITIPEWTKMDAEEIVNNSEYSHLIE